MILVKNLKQKQNPIGDLVKMILRFQNSLYDLGSFIAFFDSPNKIIVAVELVIFQIPNSYI